MSISPGPSTRMKPRAWSTPCSTLSPGRPTVISLRVPRPLRRPAMAHTSTGSAARNIGLLAASQALAGSGQAILISVAALTAASMAPDQGLATLPVTLMIIGTALSTGPAAWMIHSWGRKQGFIFGAALAVPATLVAAYAAWLQNFWIFCAALAVFGATAAFAQQYRFAAA